MKKAASLAVLAILLKNNFAAYYIGSKSRNELNNELFPTSKLSTQDIHIFTNANDAEVTKIFLNSEIKNDILNTVLVKFGGFEFEVSTCPVCIDKCDIEMFMNERDKRDITINTIAQDIEGKYIDYTYMYRNQKISAINDLKERKIRSVGNPYQRFSEDPLRIIRIFRIMSQTGYDIEKTTLKAASMHLDLLNNLSTMQIGEEFNKLLIGKAANIALLTMKKIGIFKSKIFNPFLNKQVEFLPILKHLKENQLQDLITYNNYRHHRDGYNCILDSWTLLFYGMNKKEVMENLYEFHPVNFDDMHKIEWMLDHFTIVNEKNIKQSIVDAKVGIVENNSFFIMHELIGKLLKINTVLNGIEGYETAKKVWFDFCSRPYYIEQINSKDIVELLNISDDTIVNSIKERMLPKLIFCEKYPQGNEYEKLILESAKDLGVV